MHRLGGFVKDLGRAPLAAGAAAQHIPEHQAAEQICADPVDVLVDLPVAGSEQIRLVQTQGGERADLARLMRHFFVLGHDRADARHYAEQPHGALVELPGGGVEDGLDLLPLEKVIVDELPQQLDARQQLQPGAHELRGPGNARLLEEKPQAVHRHRQRARLVIGAARRRGGLRQPRETAQQRSAGVAGPRRGRRMLSRGRCRVAIAAADNRAASPVTPHAGDFEIQPAEADPLKVNFPGDKRLGDGIVHVAVLGAAWTRRAPIKREEAGRRRLAGTARRHGLEHHGARRRRSRRPSSLRPSPPPPPWRRRRRASGVGPGSRSRSRRRGRGLDWGRGWGWGRGRCSLGSYAMLGPGIRNAPPARRGAVALELEPEAALAWAFRIRPAVRARGMVGVHVPLEHVAGRKPTVAMGTDVAVASSIGPFGVGPPCVGPLDAGPLDVGPLNIGLLNIGLLDGVGLLNIGLLGGGGGLLSMDLAVAIQVARLKQRT
ncbi:hypothetical protein Trco_003666 [Trichoderma cornu-damae]|uniref:Uncharacterized protein n=1 Tax=Trichoderma cornu-damae TaxID=654480 RepID=A0A9P8QQG4_9HYPO|nr:hypothetical protein Trco_003666 [Trichoderma cornu-damae]